VSHFIILCWDKPDAHDARMAARAAHFLHVERVIDRIAIAGPMKTDDGGFAGSIFIIDAESEADARAFLAADPYFTADIWERFEVRPFVAAAGTWIGGKIW